MKKGLILTAILISFLQLSALTCVSADNTATSGTVIKNKLFSVEIPKDLKGLYRTKTEKDKISVFDKASKKAGFGGFAFGIKAYKNPADHAVLPGSRKIGELTDKNGDLYDMVIKYPTDVQYDYTKGPKAPDSYKTLYDLGKIVKIRGIKGSTYFENQGMKGEDLYKDILKKHITAISEKWDSAKLEEENMSYMYNVLAQNNTNVLNKVGYIYYDVNKDGIDELFIGEIADGNWKGVIYDLYTTVNRKPQHVISGGSRNRFFVCDDAFICNEYSSGALESGVRVSFLEENSVILFPQVSFKYDAYTNKNKPWFLSYGSEIEDEKWENVDEKTFKERKNIFDSYIRFDFIPLNKAEF